NDAGLIGLLARCAGWVNGNYRARKFRRRAHPRGIVDANPHRNAKLKHEKDGPRWLQYQLCAADMYQMRSALHRTKLRPCWLSARSGLLLLQLARSALAELRRALRARSYFQRRCYRI